MSDTATKRLIDKENHPPKPDVSGGVPDLKSPSLPAGLRTCLHGIAGALRANFPELSKPKTADAALRILRREFIPRKRGGRPKSAAVTAAALLRAQGTPWHKVYPECLPGYWKLGKLGRRDQACKLRNAVRARKRKKWRKQTPPQ